ncbi:MAG: CDP-glycerol glycerophosphotransferase family protein [Oscillospiraceae bacterium]|nr:CDP-glycerol glycerophosphotransferase family protein [Oscillospiraceae bacterium]
MKKSIKRLIKKISKRNALFRRFCTFFLIRYKTRRYKKHSKPYNVNDKTILFQSYSGRSYSCSPRAIYEAMLEDSKYDDYTFVWAFKRPHHKLLIDFPALSRAILIRYASWEHLRYFAEAKYWVSNSRLPPELVKKTGQIYLQTWHGTPFKELAHDIQIKSKRAMSSNRELKETFTGEARLFDYLVSQSPFCSQRLLAGFDLPGIGKSNAILETGYPRNDFLINHTIWDVEQAKARIRIPKGKKVILYAPTWRDDQHKVGVGYTYEIGEDFEYLRKHLSEEWIILFRAHYLVANVFDFNKYGDFVYNVSNYDEINELYIASDMLITDYSSVFFDYSNLGKPILFYMYDKKNYSENLHGFTMPLDRLPGPCIENVKALVKSVKDIESVINSYSVHYQEFRTIFNSLDDGRAAGRVIEKFTGKQYEQKEPGRTGIILANITFSTLDYDNILWLKNAKSQGKSLIVCLPEKSFEAQRQIFEALECVDLALCGQTPENIKAYAREYKADTIIDGP